MLVETGNDLRYKHKFQGFSTEDLAALVSIEEHGEIIELYGYGTITEWTVESSNHQIDITHNKSNSFYPLSTYEECYETNMTIQGMHEECYEIEWEGTPSNSGRLYEIMSGCLKMYIDKRADDPDHWMPNAEISIEKELAVHGDGFCGFYLVLLSDQWDEQFNTNVCDMEISKELWNTEVTLRSIRVVMEYVMEQDSIKIMPKLWSLVGKLQEKKEKLKKKRPRMTITAS